MLSKNDIITVKIDDMGAFSEGIAHHEGKTIFVPFVLLGETAKVHIQKVTKNIAYARLSALVEKSPFRIQPKCPVFGKCGGCQLQHCDYTHQLTIKKKALAATLAKFGFFDEIKEVFPSKPYEYRNKMSMPLQKVFLPSDQSAASNQSLEIDQSVVGASQKNSLESCEERQGEKDDNATQYKKDSLCQEMNDSSFQNAMDCSCQDKNKENPPSQQTKNPQEQGNISTESYIFGFFAPLSNRIVQTSFCPLQNNITNSIVEVFKEFLAFSPTTKHSPTIRHLCTRTGKNGVIITVVADKEVKNIKDFFDMLTKKGIENAGLYVNINTSSSNVIFSDNFMHICGIKHLSESSRGIKYELAPASFAQVNDEIRDKLYDFVANECKNSSVLNLFSGAGLLTAILASYGGEVAGIEINPFAHSDAERLKGQNNLKNMINICGDCSFLPAIMRGESMRPFAKEAEKTGLSVVIDPPRKGCEKKVLEAIIQLKPQKIVYISCNPASLGRDLSILTESIYEITAIQPFDMFPQTSHLETVVVLHKKKNENS
jgi:23S rRNA (uracil1939-C5)-methyltransferase